MEVTRMKEGRYSAP